MLWPAECQGDHDREPIALKVRHCLGVAKRMTSCVKQHLVLHIFQFTPLESTRAASLPLQHRQHKTRQLIWKPASFSLATAQELHGRNFPKSYLAKYAC